MNTQQKREYSGFIKSSSSSSAIPPARRHRFPSHFPVDAFSEFGYLRNQSWSSVGHFLKDSKVKFNIQKITDWSQVQYDKQSTTLGIRVDEARNRVLFAARIKEPVICLDTHPHFPLSAWNEWKDLCGLKLADAMTAYREYWFVIVTDWNEWEFDPESKCIGITVQREMISQAARCRRRGIPVLEPSDDDKKSSCSSEDAFVFLNLGQDKQEKKEEPVKNGNPEDTDIGVKKPEPVSTEEVKKQPEDNDLKKGPSPLIIPLPSFFSVAPKSKVKEEPCAILAFEPIPSSTTTTTQYLTVVNPVTSVRNGVPLSTPIPPPVASLAVIENPLNKDEVFDKAEAMATRISTWKNKCKGVSYATAKLTAEKETLLKDMSDILHDMVTLLSTIRSRDVATWEKLNQTLADQYKDLKFKVYVTEESETSYWSHATRVLGGRKRMCFSEIEDTIPKIIG
jgi:hypothetical protein